MRALLAAFLFAILIAGCEVQSSSSPSLVAVTATWCEPCQRDKPKLVEVSQEFPVTVLDFDQQRADADRLGVSSVPTYVVYDANGKEVQRFDNLKRAIWLLRKLYQLSN